MTQRLIRAQGLQEAQLADIAALADACNQAEGLTMRLNWPSLRRRPAHQVNDFLAYKGASSIGFLGLFQFSLQEAEATAMTHPAYRRQGIFRQLLAEARAELRQRGVPSMLFFAERKSPAVEPVARCAGATYEHTEYLMRAAPENVHLSPLLPGLELRLATRADLPCLTRLDAEAFGVAVNENHFLEYALSDPGQRLWVITLAGECIGKIQGRAAEHENHIYGFAVRPDLRGRGYGRAALSEAMRRLLAEHYQKTSLEVMTGNEHALKLYQSRGFEVVTAYDYYRLPVNSN